MLAARGKSKWVGTNCWAWRAAYLEAPNTPYGASNPTELAVSALYDGQFCFADVMGDSRRDG